MTPVRSWSPTTIHEASRPVHQHLRGISLHRRRTTFTRVTNGSGQSPFRQYLWRPGCSLQQANPDLVYGLARWQCGLHPGRLQVHTSGDPNSWTHFCVHTNGGDDRESGWADNNPSSPFFGRMYVSWNDFNRPSETSSSRAPLTMVLPGAAAIMVSTRLPSSATRRSPVTCLATATVYIAGMDEGGGGFPHNDTNLIFKSTDGGLLGATPNWHTLPGTGRTSSGYFACMFSDNGWPTGGTRAGVSLLLQQYRSPGLCPARRWR